MTKEDFRIAFGEEIRSLVKTPGKTTENVISAFSDIKREDFAGPGPWKIIIPSRIGMLETIPESDPRHLYRNILIALDADLGINVGEPALWANMLNRLGKFSGKSILQIGGGSGYYSAILASLVGKKGHVTAFELNPKVAKLGASAISQIPNLDFRIGDATSDLSKDDGPFDIIISYAGVTHPKRQWIEKLCEQGTMLLPIVGRRGWGAMVQLTKSSSNLLKGKTLGPCGFFLCVGAHDQQLAASLDLLLADTSKQTGWEFSLMLEPDCMSYLAGDAKLTFRE